MSNDSIEWLKKLLDQADSTPKVGRELSQEELAKHFNEWPEKENKIPTFSSPEEVEKWEKEQENSNDIYKVAARVKNLARSNGAALTPAGEVLCNSYVHVILSLYNFADTLPKVYGDELKELVKSHENMPANVISLLAPKGKKR